MGASGSILAERCLQKGGSSGSSQSDQKKNYKDFTIGSFIAEGVSGKVHSATNEVTKKNVALKFFGYCKDYNAKFEDINHEIEAMQAVIGIEGLVQIQGFFLDTKPGLLPDKLQLQTFPVIEMELLEGGPLFGRINYRDTISEKFISHIFKKMTVALQSLHNKNFIHRDIKLDNVMFLEKTYDSPIKIIDLGNVIELDSTDAVFQGNYIVGTSGYLAPESLMRKEYSKKSDIWQAGCTLYSLLSGTPPFDPNNDKQITHFGYYPMVGPAWDDVSSCAKSLVSKLLKKNPDHRLSVEEILKHPWLVDDAPDKDFNQDYFVRIKHLALRNKMKTFFLESALVEGNMKRRKSLREVLPIFKQASDVALLSEKQLQSDHGSSEVRNNVEVFNSKLKVLKHMVVSSISSNLTEGNKEIDYTTFTNMLKECNLQELCSLQIFNIFDIGNTGTIDPREFLLTMVAFRHDKPMRKIDDTREIEAYHDMEATALGDCKSDDSSDYESASNRDDEVRLLFNLFDIKDAGYIELDELRIAVNFLLYMGSDQPQTLPNIHELFSTIDVGKNGRIGFPEFKQFYKHLIASHISLKNTK